MTSKNITVHPLDVRDKTYEVQVTPGGSWITEQGSQTIFGATRQELYDKLMVLTKKAATKVRVPFAVVSRTDCSRGIAYGLHGGNSNVLVEWTSGERRRILGRSGPKEQFSGSGYGATTIIGEITDAEVAEYQALLQAKTDAEKAVSGWLAAHAREHGHGLSLIEAVKAAVEEAVSEGS